ncbi:ParB/RepB/Spo0J family partition protein [Streptomyces sp. NPDC088915]|uniref:ParB/RepB/Spo0J family partition protein n=1 Tax=Streptomyces sp. NPDC088915 TaxID=3365912 RepID=UPI00381A0E31
MAISPQKPRRSAKVGKGTSETEKPKTGIYDIPDGNWDLKDVSLKDICPNPFNDRDMGDLDELAHDIETDGLLEPVSILSSELFIKEYGQRFPDKCAVVAEAGTKYVLGYGERRWRASGMARLSEIKAIVRNDLVSTIRFALIKENYHRKDPTEIEQARHINRLATEEKMSYREIADALSIKSIGTISKRIRLLELPAPAQEALEQKRLGVTAALGLLELPEEEQQLAALHLILDSEGKLRVQDAVHQILVHGVSPRNASEEEPSEQTDTETPPESPEELEIETDSEPNPPADEKTDTPSPNEKAAGTGDDAPQPPAPPQSPVPSQRPAVPLRTAASSKKGADTDRYTANKERDLACVDLLRRGAEVSTEAREAVIRRALLAGKGDARKQAHVWLVQSNKAHFDIKDTDAYFQAVLSSGDADLVGLATFVTALAANEARASDRRRPSWDMHDASYVLFLIEAGNYVPETQWEKAELTRLGVSLGNAHDPEHLTDQESL